MASLSIDEQVMAIVLQDFPLSNQQRRLLSASLKAFSESGYLETSVQDIVKLARTSKSTFYKHYKNKDGILVHLFQLIADALTLRVERTLDSYPPTSQRTYKAIKTYIDTCFNYREIAKLLMVDTVGLCPELERMRFKVIDYFAHIFQRELTSTPEESVIPTEKWILSHAMVGAVNQIVIQSLSLVVPPSTEVIANVLEQMLSRILRDPLFDFS